MNAKVGRDDRGKERIKGQHGADATMKENGLRAFDGFLRSE